MRKLLCFTSFLSLLLVVPTAALPGSAAGAETPDWRAGLAKIVITPDEPIWMSGYAQRNKPSEGKIHDLHAKALALQDTRRNRLVLVTTDLLGLPRSLSDSIARQVEARYRLPRANLVLSSSHTHTGPVVRQSLVGSYGLDAEQSARVQRYGEKLQEKIVTVVGEALANLTPAKVSFGRAEAHFGVNRREPTAAGVKLGINRNGPVDPDVFLLRVDAPEGRLRSIVMSYACHNTTLTGNFYQIAGDYSGFAQETLERTYPEALALFVMGCGGDIDPQPRGTLDLARQHGEELAGAVKKALQGSFSPVRGPLKARFERFMIPLAPSPSREEYQARLNDRDVFIKRHAERMIARMEGARDASFKTIGIRDGRLLSEYPYTLQVLQFGKDLTVVALAGEVVVDYALRLKRELGSQGLWVAAYCNDVFAYIPSARVLKEGGYEADRSMIYYDMPGPWAPQIEEIIIQRVHRQVRHVGRQ
ncbi:MAG TPA: neutral/alkaline non-lysosomal ceramidase N-terminal domain-containing protein [Acidobacteriota bacterium]|jgi:hypothetical protein